jgi:hypothetical protein
MAPTAPRPSCLLAAAVALVVTGCAAPAPAPEADPQIRARLAEAEQVTRDFQRQLGGALMTAMRTGGPPAAIAVCAQRAPALAAAYTTPARRVYRVGTRVRNPRQGTPDPVERRLLGRLAAEHQPSVFEIERDAAGRARGLRYLKAIHVGADLCLKCHGGPADLAPGVREALRATYPDDQAVGYRRGDLRGAFVVHYRW